MAWTTPLTAVANASLTAAQWNASVRDNFLETAPAKATTAGGIFAATGANAVAERIPNGATVGTTETTGSTGYTALATAGPTMSSVTTGVRALVLFGCSLTNDTAGQASYHAYAVSGSSTAASTDATGFAHHVSGAARIVMASRVIMQGLNAGSNTFTSQYRVTGGTGTFSQRTLAVFPL